MKWLVQDDIRSPHNVVRMKNALKVLNVPYLVIKINKDLTLSVLDEEWQLPIEDGDEVLEDFVKDSKVFVYGTKKLSDIAKEKGWKPGSFVNEKFDFDYLQKTIKEELLNDEFEIGYLWNLKPKEDVFFARPNGNTKLFTGKVMTKEEFKEWQEDEGKKETSFAKEKIIISPLKNIQAEYRFFVVEGEVITTSSYVVDGKTNIEKEVPKGVVEYAKGMVLKNPIAKAFVIDIAETTEGCKVVEYNNINCSGLYSCDEYKIIEAINGMGSEI